MVAVAVQLGHGNLVVRLPTPEEKEIRAKKKKGSVWLAKDNAAASPLTSGNYVRYVLTPLAKADNKMGAGKRRSPRRPVMLVHDKDSVHTSQETAGFAARHGIQLIELPARSPDLDPLDYGVFGAIKREWSKRVFREQLDWESQCSLLIELLQATDASAAIRALPGRIQKCIDANGSRFEK